MKVVLRNLRESDANISYKWRNDPEIWVFTGSRPDKTITPEIEREWIRGVLQKKDQKRFAICINEDRKYIGNVQLTDINDHSAEFHIFIGEKKFWGMGIASETTRKIVKYGFETLGLNEIFLFVHKRNVAAIRSYKKCGFIESEFDENKIKMTIVNG